MIATLPSQLQQYWQAFNKRASRSYVAGGDLASAIQVCHTSAQQKIASTIAYWNNDNDAPRFVADTYLSALTVLTAERLELL